MNQRDDVRRLNIVDIRDIRRKVWRFDLVRKSGICEKRRAFGMESGVLLSEFNHHRLSSIERERNQYALFVSVLRRAHKLESGAVLHRPLREDDEVLALRESRLIAALIVDAAEHRGRLFPARKGILNDLVHRTNTPLGV